MWSRIKRFIRSVFGTFLSFGEDPRKILEQSVRDMRDKIPEMNTGIAKARAGLIRLENESATYRSEVRGLTAKIKACLTAGDEKLATQLAVRLKSVSDALGRNQEQLQCAKGGYETLLRLKERYHREMQRKTDEAMDAIRQSEASKWKEELAETFQSFEVASVDLTHDEMMAQLRYRNAEAEGRLAMALDSVEVKTIEMEERAREIEGRELLQQFKLEMGMGSAEIAPQEAARAVEREVAAVAVRA